MDTWIDEDAKQKVRKVFEPRYKRLLSNDETIAIAENLEVVVEELLKLQWRKLYG